MFINSPPISKPVTFRDVFCGRESELLTLEGVFRRTAGGRTPFPNLVLVGGAPGTGKTALTSKLREHLLTTEEEFFWISGKFEEGQQQQLIVDSAAREQIANPGGSRSTTSSSDVSNSNGEKTDTLHPFGAIVDAFSHFCEELEEEEPETLKEVKDDILEAVGQQGGLLTDMIPSLTKIIGVQRQAGRESQNSEMKRFHLVFRNFIQALASQCRSVVLVLDDIHRADAASLELLCSLVTSTQLKHIMFLGTYRMDEVGANHRLTKWIDRVQETQRQTRAGDMHEQSMQKSNQSSNTWTTLTLPTVDLETINTFISGVLDLKPAKTRDLAHIIFAKTGGNYFYANQYLLFLRKKELLRFDYHQTCWGWDEEDVRKEAAITTTLLDFLHDKLSHCETARALLPVAACLGAKFNRETLGMVLTSLSKINALKETLQAPSSDVDLQGLLLRLCNKEGFIDNCGNKSYRFVHDKMQEVSLTLHPTSIMERIRYEVGKVLLNQFTESELNEKLFLVANLLNGGHMSLDGDIDLVAPLEISRLNLKAAEKAKRMAAFSSAATYADNALYFLTQCTQEEDESYHAMLLQICSLGAEVEGATGQTANMEMYCNKILNNQEQYSVLEQLRIQNALMDNIANVGGKMGIALERCLGILEQLGCTFPKLSIGQGIRAVSSLLKGKAKENIPAFEDIDKLPLMTEPAKLEAMRLLDRLATYAYLEANVLLFTLCTTRMARWTIRYGICEKSPAAFGLISMVMMHVLGDFEAGLAYGELAMSMTNKLQLLASQDESQRAMLTQSQSRATFVANGFVLFWAKSVQDYNDELVTGYESGMRAGDTESACWNIQIDVAIKFSAGCKLKELEKLCRMGVSTMAALQKGEAVVYTSMIWQGILNLMNFSIVEGTTKVSGSAVKEEDYLSQQGAWGSKQLPNFHDHTKTFLCAFFGDYETGAELAVERGDRFLVDSPGNHLCQTDPFYQGVCLFAAAGKDRAKRRLYRRHGQKRRTTLHTWVRKGSLDSVHRLQLLDAEQEASLRNPKGRESVKILFDLACGSATSRGFIHDAALANERYAEFLLLSADDHEEGTKRVYMAARLYSDWGATAKVESLLATHEDLSLSKLSLVTTQTTSPSTPLSRPFRNP